jgi:hypothetical protein
MAEKQAACIQVADGIFCTLGSALAEQCLFSNLKYLPELPAGH